MISITQSRDVHPFYTADGLVSTLVPSSRLDTCLSDGSRTIRFATTKTNNCKFLDLFNAALLHYKNNPQSEALNFLFDYEYNRLMSMPDHADDYAWVIN